MTEKSNLNNIDISGLDEASRKNIHRILYRQECRIWLLAAGLAFGSYFLMKESTSLTNDSTKYIFGGAVIIYTVFLSFWAGYPSQTILNILRKSSQFEDTKEIENGFVNSWGSVWDFVPPLLIPVLLFLALLGFKLWLAM